MSTIDQEMMNDHQRRASEYLATFHQDDIPRLCSDESKNRRLLVNLNDLREFDPTLARDMLARPSQYLPAFEKALREEVVHHDPKQSAEVDHFYVGVEGSFGANKVSPRGLMCHLLNQLVCVEGIVTRCSSVHPKVVKSVHYCAETGVMMEREYHDLTSLTGLPTSSNAYPTRNQEGQLLRTEFGLCTYRDHQIVSVQEMPERAPPGQLPRSVDVMIENELVDCCRPGDRVCVSGIFRALPAKQSTTGMFRTLVLGNNVKLLSKEAYGHGLRGSAHRSSHALTVLMVGDPSTAKSQMLRFALGIAPLAVSTTGRGSSGVGLTAAVTTDADTGEKRLEAGAMVIADRGLCCIDEFDKMLDADRVAIHEVMEQQTITIAKAGIHASLNARASVLAAANPVYSKYDSSHTPMENIGLPESLLSRFDLLFIVLDTRSSDVDRAISGHVLQMHRTAKTGATPAALSMSGGRGGDVIEDSLDVEEVDATGQTPMYVKFERGSLQVGPGGRRGRGKVTQTVLSTAFIKKYISYAKDRVAPTLSEEARELIATEYANLRQRSVETEGCLPVTPRSLETMIRLATAFAKLHLRAQVLEEDVRSAISILHGALFKDIPKAGGKGKGDDEQGDEDEDGGHKQVPASPSTSDKENRAKKRGTPGSSAKKGKAAAKSDDEPEQDDEFAAFADENEAGPSQRAASPAGPPGQDEEEPMPVDQLPEGALAAAKSALGKMVQATKLESFSIAEVFSAFVDECEADGPENPTMGMLLGVLSRSDSPGAFSNGTVYVSF
ncbi:MCM2/3/5 family-domain-containing protein [Pavlovales sp. CCMP2436]|nr:MCM2/3/5 family-domain-containing protein [Pavlovales sp. CCMP2436]